VLLSSGGSRGVGFAGATRRHSIHLRGSTLSSAGLWDRYFFGRATANGLTGPLEWAKTVERETLCTGGYNLTDIARSTNDENPRGIISRRLKEAAQNLIGKLWRRGRKRKAGGAVVKRRQKVGKKRRLTKRDIFS